VRSIGFPLCDEEVIPAISLAAGNYAALELVFAHVNFTCTLLSGVVPAMCLLKTVGVVEVQSIGSSGTGDSLPWGVGPPVVPSYSWKSVLGSLSKRDPEWYINAFQKVTTLVGGTASAGMTMGLPGALAYLTAGVAGMAFGGARAKGVRVG